LSIKPLDSVDWTLLVGYSREEAEEILQEEAVSYEIVVTAPPRKTADPEELRVIAVQTNDKLRLIVGTPDWSVN
jgi:hypothetical protein